MLTLPFRKRSRTRSRAQALLEFGLALPILLLVVYGLLETGRLLFIYASTVTAARQAVRYGSATGDSSAGVPFYQDCVGIRGAIHRVGFINRFDDANIQITYDRGISKQDENGDGSVDYKDVLEINSPAPKCEDGFTGFDIRSGDRIRVDVSSQWTPIVPLVPFEPFVIRSESARTILSNVSIFVTAPSSGWAGSGGGDLLLTVSASPTIYDHVGQVITYTYTIKNTGSGDLTQEFGLHDEPVTPNNCASVAPATLAVGASYSCTGTYSITQEDLDTGFVTNAAQASANTLSVFSNISGTTITSIQQPQLTLTKVGVPEASSIVGTVITYTYTLTNTGNVTVRPPYTLSDDKSNDETCPQTPSMLPPGDGITCTAHYAIKTSDIGATRVVNRATATALFRANTVTSNVATFTVYTPPVYLTLTITPLSVNAAGQTITYTYNLRNSTDTPLEAPYTVTDSRVTNESCAGATSPLPAGATTQCTGTYTVTQADMDAATALTNTVVATAMQAAKVRSSQEVTGSVGVAWTAALGLQVTAAPSTAAELNDVITYTYVMTNTGNVTLSPTFSITDDKITGITCSDPSATLAPGATKTCTGTKTVTVADIAAGSITNTATASATFKGNVYASSPVTTMVTTYTAARITLDKKASVDVVYAAGIPVVYTYTIKNTGGVPIYGPFTIEDDRIAAVDCSLAAATLAVGDSTTCTGTYTTTAGDLAAGYVTNTAHAHGTDGTDPVESAPYSATVYVSDKPCSIKHSALQYSPFRMVIFNHNLFPIMLKNVTVTFYDNPPASQWITSLVLGGNTIWTNTLNHGSPYTATTLTGVVSVPGGGSEPLVVNFKVAYTSNAVDRIVVGFVTTGCSPLDSSDPGQQEPVGP